VAWFDIEPDRAAHYQPDTFPVFILDEERADDDAGTSSATTHAGAALPRSWYGFPDSRAAFANGGATRGPGGLKIGLYNHLNEHVDDPDTLDRDCFTEEDEEALRAGLAYLPGAAKGRVLARSTCMFTNTPDGHFLVDWHPADGCAGRVMLCSACSGHGFKMSSGIGQLIAAQMCDAAGRRFHPAPYGGSGRCGDGEIPTMADVENELSLHRFAASRPGHTAFLSACGNQA
jgi:sarcosine oxidase